MKLTVQLKLQPTPQQANALVRTLETANAACEYISQVAWESTTFRQFAIHRLAYQTVREIFGLAAQLTVLCTSCGFAGPADVIAAGNIARRAAVNRPYCSEAEVSAAPEQSRRL